MAGEPAGRNVRQAGQGGLGGGPRREAIGDARRAAEALLGNERGEAVNAGRLQAGRRRTSGDVQRVKTRRGYHAVRCRRLAQVASGLRATVAKRVRVARSIFARAVDWEYIDRNPFAKVKIGSQRNPDRLAYVPPDVVAKVLDACPSQRWRVLVALARFAGLRVPSEIVPLTWGRVDWDRRLLTVKSPKTAGHEGHEVRTVPIAPELFAVLLDLREVTGDVSADTPLVPNVGRGDMNLRTTLLKIIDRAGVKAWPRLFQNLRASCEMDWVETVPAHTAADWLGHSPTIAARHYLKVRDRHFSAVTGVDATDGAPDGARTARQTTQQATATKRKETNKRAQTLSESDAIRFGALARKPLQNKQMGAEGFEPS
jgi:integrase